MQGLSQLGNLCTFRFLIPTKKMNGLYLVDQTQEMNKSGFGMRHYFKARILWQMTMQNLEDLFQRSKMQGFLRKHEPISSPDGFRLEITSEKDRTLELELGDPIINFLGQNNEFPLLDCLPYS